MRNTTTETALRAWAEAGGNWKGFAEKHGMRQQEVTLCASVLGIRSGYNRKAKQTDEMRRLAALKRAGLA
jgi:hypothetical protein